MSRGWLWTGGGWEHGPVRTTYAATGNQQRDYVEGPYGDAQGSGGDPPEQTVVGSGKFAFLTQYAGFSRLTDGETAHVFARTKDWIFWCGRVGVTGFDATPTATDTYSFARCTEHLASADGDYLGVAVKVADATSYTLTIVRFNQDGSFDTDLLGISAQFTVSSTMRWWVLALDASNGASNCRLWVEDTGGALVTSGTVQTTGHLLHDNDYLTGKSGTANPDIYLDCHASAEGDSESDKPLKSTRQIAYQPIKNVTGENAWTGSHQDVDDENDDSVAAADTDANVCTPTAENQLEIFAFPDLASEGGQTATVEAVLLCWEQPNEDPPRHAAMARTTSAILTSLGAHGWGEHGDSVGRTWCGRLMRTTPEGLPWTPALFNQIQAGLKAAASPHRTVGELYLIPTGAYIDRPTATADPPGDIQWEDPPAGAVTHIRQGVALGSANAMMY